MEQKKSDNLTFQTFLVLFAHHTHKYGSGYYHRTKWLQPTINRSQIAFDPILLCMKFDGDYVFWNHHRYDCSSKVKSITVDEELLTKIVTTLPGKLDYAALKSMSMFRVSVDLLKRVVVSTGDLNFYWQFCDKYWGSKHEFTTLDEIKQIVTKLASIQLKVTAENHLGYQRLIEGLHDEISKCVNIDPYVEFYKELRTPKGYTTSTRAKMITALIEKGKGDPKCIDKVKKLLKKEKSKRVWTEFKRSVLDTYFPTETKYDYQKGGTIGKVEKGKLKELIEFIASIDNTPELAYGYRGGTLTSVKTMLEKGLLTEKEEKDASDSSAKVR